MVGFCAVFLVFFLIKTNGIELILLLLIYMWVILNSLFLVTDFSIGFREAFRPSSLLAIL